MSPGSPEDFIGRSPDELTLVERLKLTGQWVAFELYTPRTLPLRRIEALASTPQGCISQLRARGLDPRNFEIEPLKPPY